MANATLFAQTISSSTLPLILLETAGQTIPFEKINAHLNIIDNPAGQVNHPGDLPVYEGLFNAAGRQPLIESNKTCW